MYVARISRPSLAFLLPKRKRSAYLLHRRGINKITYFAPCPAVHGFWNAMASTIAALYRMAHSRSCRATFHRQLRSTSSLALIPRLTEKKKKNELGCQVPWNTRMCLAGNRSDPLGMTYPN